MEPNPPIQAGGANKQCIDQVQQKHMTQKPIVCTNLYVSQLKLKDMDKVGKNSQSFLKCGNMQSASRELLLFPFSTRS
jgi:hypothetical protein